ncbi:MAG: Tad domain-containing protein [Anaerolineales bacterium]
MKNMKSERGQVLIIFALAAIALFGIVGLAIDGSAKFSDRRHAQNAADTAALAAALAKSNALTAGSSNSPVECPPTSGIPSDVCTALLTAGLDQAANNGYDNNLVRNTVEVYSPPISGYYTGDSTYIQVIITSHVNTTFSRVVGVEQTHNVVEAVALTKEGGALGNGAMIISYDPDPNCSSGVGSGGGSVDVSGNSTVTLDGGGIFLNSDETCGYSAPNCPTVTITGGGINTAGGDNIDQACQTADEFYNQDQVAIPDEVYWPDVPPECSIPATANQLGVDPSDGKGEWLIHPGYYEDFPQAALVANKQHIYMASGVYCIDPGGTSRDFDLSWSPVDFVSLNGSTDPSENKYHAYNPDGVTLYIKNGGGFTINANNPTYLDGSTSGDYQGYLIILEGNHTSIENCSITGGADVDINGLIFAPYCDITITGGSSSIAVINAQLIGWDIAIAGGAGINFNYDPSNQVIIKNKIALMK